MTRTLYVEGQDTPQYGRPRCPGCEPDDAIDLTSEVVWTVWCEVHDLADRTAGVDVEGEALPAHIEGYLGGVANPGPDSEVRPADAADQRALCEAVRLAGQSPRA